MLCSKLSFIDHPYIDLVRYMLPQALNNKLESSTGVFWDAKARLSGWLHVTINATLAKLRPAHETLVHSD